MPDRRPTDSILPLADPPDTVTMNTIRRAERALRKMLEPAHLLMPPSLVERFRDTPMESAAEHLFGPRLGSYMGLTVRPAPALLYRPPEKPRQSRPRRRCIRAFRKPMKPELVRIRGQTLVSWRGWKGRKVPDRTGYTRNSVFLFNPRSILAWPGDVT
jgi:hypothetical protein